MSDFLDFLNTASADRLTGVPGMNRTLAENLIAARPFSSPEDCLKVKGMGKTLLSKLELFAEAQGIESENRAMISAGGEAPSGQTSEGETFFSRMRRASLNFLRALVRFVALVILMVGVGALLYFGLPVLYETFIAPVEQNTTQIRQMEAEIDLLRAELEETRRRVDALEFSVEAHTRAIHRLEEMQSVIETQLQESNDTALHELRLEVMLSRALDILARARLYLAQSNFGLAKLDVQAARDLLAQLQSEKGDATLGQALARLDMALRNLPDFPVVASGDLEIAWQLLTSGGAPPAATATFTPTPAPMEEMLSPTPTPFPPPAVDATATP